MRNAYEKIAYYVIRRCLRDALEKHSADYKAGYVQGVVDLQTEIFKELEHKDIQTTLINGCGFDDTSIQMAQNG